MKTNFTWGCVTLWFLDEYQMYGKRIQLFYPYGDLVVIEHITKKPTYELFAWAPTALRFEWVSRKEHTFLIQVLGFGVGYNNYMP